MASTSCTGSMAPRPVVPAVTTTVPLRPAGRVDRGPLFLFGMTRRGPPHYSQGMAKPVPLGARGEVEKRVEFQHTLMAWREELPAGLATPNMIGWMEAAGPPPGPSFPGAGRGPAGTAA